MGRSIVSTNVWRSAVVVLSVLGMGAVLSACGGGSGSSASTSSTSTTMGDSPSEQLQALTSSAHGGQNATFVATWTSTSSGKTTTLTLAQSPPKSYFAAGSGFLLNTGSKTYYCTSSAYCIVESGTNPLSSLVGIYNGQSFINSVQAYQSAAILKTEGVTLTFSTGTYGGVSSNCVNVQHASSTAKWCVGTSAGVLTYWSADGDSFTLKSYSSSPPASDFTLPSGAKVVTL